MLPVQFEVIGESEPLGRLLLIMRSFLIIRFKEMILFVFRRRLRFARLFPWRLLGFEQRAAWGHYFGDSVDDRVEVGPAAGLLFGK